MLKSFSKEDCSSVTNITEEQIMRDDILQAYHKLDRSWNNFMNAEEDYIDIAIMEIYNDELRIGILIKKLKTLLGETECIGQFDLKYRELPWFK